MATSIARGEATIGGHNEFRIHSVSALPFLLKGILANLIFAGLAFGAIFAAREMKLKNEAIHVKTNYQIAHDEAVRQGQTSYIDPDANRLVFTELGLRQRGKCCGCGCRHCPFQHEKVPMAARLSRIQNPAWLTDPAPASTHVLFWSGGKDSFLALRAMTRAQPNIAITLLSTFDATTRMVAHQEIALKEIVEQAAQLQLPLIGVPLSSGDDYMTRVEAGLALLDRVDILAFGDLHLEHIRSWREEAFAGFLERAQAKLHFPIWHREYDTLVRELIESGVGCKISAASHPLIKHLVGQPFDSAFLQALPEGIDAFGESGEFHTRVDCSGL